MEGWGGGEGDGGKEWGGEWVRTGHINYIHFSIVNSLF